MTQPFLPLFLSNLRAWFGTKGFVMVAVAALVPLALTGAWVATHRADVSAVSLTWDDTIVRDGDVVNFTGVVRNDGATAVGPFNATLAVGSVFNGRFLQSAGNTTLIEGLAPGESRELRIQWTAESGIYFALLDADTPNNLGEDALGEVDEYDNQIALPLAVGYAPGPASEAPRAPANITGVESGAALADAAVGALAAPGAVAPGGNVTLSVGYRNDGPDRLENATVTLRVGRMFGGRFVPTQQTTEDVALDPGEAGTLTLRWTALEGAYWQEAWINVTGNASDPDPGNNHVASSFTVDPSVAGATRPDIPEKLTIKEFYGQTLSLLHLTVLVPLIALFYGAGVITDERERGSLAYLLTRPVARWLIPVTKFVASYIVAATALTLSIVVTYLVLFQATPQGADVGLLTTPLFLSLLALLAYGAIFVLLGVVVERPYLVGLAFVLGWEVIAASFVPWVENLTLKHWINKTLYDAATGTPGWRLDGGLQWLPEGEAAMGALRVVLVTVLVALVAAGAMMKKREFEV